MKIIIVHYRFYESGGPETYLFNIIKLLSEKGHEIIPFSIDYPENKDSKYSKYFSKPIIKNFHFNNNQNSISFINKLRIIRDSFFNKNVFNSLQNLIDNVNPDAAYVLQYGVKLSTSIFDVLSKNQIPVLLRLSDFNLICAKNIFYRNGDVCTKCITNKYNSVLHSCVNDNLLQSTIYFAIQKFNDIRHFEKKINAFIVPSLFTYELLSKVKQFKNSKIFHIPTFSNKVSNENSLKPLNYNLKNGLKLCFVGRVAEDKGVDILIDAVKILLDKNINVSLDIYGAYSSDYAQIQRENVESLELKSIFFKGYVKSKSIIKIYKKYHFSVIPSRCYDNMPNSLIESCSNGIPVIASKIGSLDELIEDGFNGYKFESDSSVSLASVIESLFYLNQNKYNNLSYNALNWVNKHCDINSHYDKLITVFNKVIYEKNN
jgi:glycosyltransferase involved in cell wall biosynthesis